MRRFHTLSCVLTSSVTLLDVLDQSGSVRRVEAQAKTCLNVPRLTKCMGSVGPRLWPLHPFSERDVQRCRYAAELRSRLTCSCVAGCPRTSFHSRHSEGPWRRCSRSRRRTSDSWRGAAEPRLTGRSGTRSPGEESSIIRRATQTTRSHVLALDELPASQKSRRCLWAAA